jgi:hypothetical protein
MSLQQQLADVLARRTPGGYGISTTGASREAHMSEPTAWAAIALVEAGRLETAARSCTWLSQAQQKDGSVGVSSTELEPCWPTALALLAWYRWQQATGDSIYNDCIERGLKWTLDARGSTSPRKPQIGHDTRLLGWSWAAGTHSWQEPTAMFSRAGHELGLGDHPRFREAVRMLVDRILPSGGCNYGNTIVLGQELLPHVQPTGLVLWSLAASKQRHAKIDRSLDYLDTAIDEKTTTISLAYAVMGFGAHDRLQSKYYRWLARRAKQELAGPTSTYKLALLTMAAHAAREFDNAKLAASAS